MKALKKVGGLEPPKPPPSATTDPSYLHSKPTFTLYVQSVNVITCASEKSDNDQKILTLHIKIDAILKGVLVMV